MDSFVSYHVLKTKVNRAEIRYILHFCCDKGENAETVNADYDPNIVIAIYRQFWFRPFHSDNVDVKGAPRIGTPFVENVDNMR